MGIVGNAVRKFVPSSLCIHRLNRRKGNSVLLTFDDGPHESTTAQVLDRLRAFNAKAVFFVVGDRIPRAPWMLKQILAEGHWIGNHSYSHPMNRRMNFREYLMDLERCQEAVFKETNSYPKLHRPPLGRITLAGFLATKRLGLITMHWSVSAEDWQFRGDDVAVRRGHELANIIVHSDVVLFHDERPHMLKTLDILLPALRARGVNLRPDEQEFV